MNQNSNPSMEISYIKSERKFHDAWAFVLFVTLTIGLNAFYMFNTSSITAQAGTITDSHGILQMLVGNLGFTFVMIMFSLVLLYLIPKAIILTSTIMIPFLSIVGWFSMAKDSIYGVHVGIVLAVINTIFILIVAFTVLKNLTYISNVISVASRIILDNILSVSTVCLVMTLLMVASSASVALVDSDSNVVRWIRWVEVLMGWWKFTILVYFVRVFVSSIVVGAVAGARSVVGPALRNAVYGLGSISYGALLIAIIITLRTMIGSARDRNNNRGGKSHGSDAALAIAEFFLSALQAIVETSNQLAFPYLSVHGTGYEDSVSESFKLITSSGVEKISSLSGVSFSIGLLSFMFLNLCAGFNYFFYLRLINPSIQPDALLIWSIVISGIFTFLFGAFLSLLDDAVLALIYTMATIPNKAKEFSLQFYEAFEAKKADYIQVNSNNNVGLM